MIVTERCCRHCGSRLDSILTLGDLYPSCFPYADECWPPRVPLDLCACTSCRLVQLRHTVDPDSLYKDHYWYHSGINEVMRAELADIVTQGIARVGRFRYADRVLDVGANDGTLLAEYRKHHPTLNVPRIAYEPASNLQPILSRRAEVRYQDYFPPSAQHLKGFSGRVKILTSIAMFYDLDDPHAFVEAVKTVLHPEGVWIVQFQDLHQMMQANAFDNICHEHLVYYSLESFERLIAQHGLCVVDAEARAINGGSYRLYVKHETATTTVGASSGRVDALRKAEAGCQDWHTLERFAWRVGQVRAQLQAIIEQYVKSGQIIDIYGASTKGNTLCQYVGLDESCIRQAIERSPEKVGRRTVTGIPIVSEQTARDNPADAWLCNIWQFREAVLTREQQYLAHGGSIIFPLPSVEVVRERASRPATSSTV